MRQIIYVKYNRTRSEKFQLKTAIVRENGALSVEKTALTEAGAGHMGSFWEKYQMIREQNPRIRFLEPEFKDGGKTVCFRYLEGETLADALADRIHMGQIPYEELEQVMALVFPEDFSVDSGHFSIKEQTGGPFAPSQGFTEVFGPVPEGLEELGRLTAAPNVDGLFENLMISGGHVYGIDYEWVFDMEIPARFLHYRNLLYFYRRCEASVSSAQEELFAHFGIGEEEQRLFASMEEHFQAYVHGNGGFQYMKQYEQPVKSLEELLEAHRKLPEVVEWCETLNQTVAERDVTIQKQQEVQRLTNNHVANLDVIIADLRRENGEIAKTLQYLSKHESVVWKGLRKCHRLVDRAFPEGTRKRKVLKYVKNTIRHPGKYLGLYLTGEGRNRIGGDFQIGEGYLEHGKLRFPYFEEPEVSVVIPVYNQIHYTYACLVSILQNTPDVSYEIIIADDVSTDATRELSRYAELSLIHI